MSGVVTHFLPDGAPRLDRFLAESYPAFARSRWDAWVRAGNVTVNGEVVRKAGTRIRAGATVSTELPDPAPPALHLQPEAIDLPTLFEDSHLWIVDKPAGMVVHPGPGHPSGTVLNALLGRLRAPPSSWPGTCRKTTRTRCRPRSGRAWCTGWTATPPAAWPWPRMWAASSRSSSSSRSARWRSATWPWCA